MSTFSHNHQLTTEQPAEVFISYARSDSDKVARILDQLAPLGIQFWLDHKDIEGGRNFAIEITSAIKQSRVFVLMCSNAAQNSRHVRQELMLAWKYHRPYLPLLLEPLRFTEQFEYFLEGIQWIEIFDFAPAEWLPRISRALALAGVGISSPIDVSDTHSLQPSQVQLGLAGLRSVASFNNSFWPLPADRFPRDWERPAVFRDIGAEPQAQRVYRLGSSIGLAIRTERAGHLLLLDQAHDGTTYCLCPSKFAPDTHIKPGLTYLPQRSALYHFFEVSGKPGREELLAIITDQQLDLDWMPPQAGPPARVLSATDVEVLLAQLKQLDSSQWTALATYFDVVQ